MRILNVGCGNETYGTHFLDMYPMRRGVIKHNADRDKIPFPSNYFDEVYSRTVFEHLTNPLFALKEMARVLKPKGKIILITDNAHYWLFAFNLHMHKRTYGKEDRHYLLVNEHHMRNWFEKVGLKVTKIEYIKDNYKCSSPYTVPFKMIINTLLPKRLTGVNIRVEGTKQ